MNYYLNDCTQLLRQQGPTVKRKWSGKINMYSYQSLFYSLFQ